MAFFQEPRLEVTNSGSNSVVRFVHCSSLTDYHLELFSGPLTALAESPGTRHVLVDLAGIDFLTSTALGKFIGMNRKLKAEGGGLALINAGPMVREILTVTGLDKLFEVRSTPDDLAQASVLSA